MEDPPRQLEFDGSGNAHMSNLVKAELCAVTSTSQYPSQSPPPFSSLSPTLAPPSSALISPPDSRESQVTSWHLPQSRSSLPSIHEALCGGPNLKSAPPNPSASPVSAYVVRPERVFDRYASQTYEKNDPEPNQLFTQPRKRRSRAPPPGRCHSCNRAESPEWRRGPDGARTLCNACGLHYAKLTRKSLVKQAHYLRPSQRDDNLYNSISLAETFGSSSSGSQIESTAKVGLSDFQSESLSTNRDDVHGSLNSSEKGLVGSEAQLVRSPSRHSGYEDKVKSGGNSKINSDSYNDSSSAGPNVGYLSSEIQSRTYLSHTLSDNFHADGKSSDDSPQGGSSEVQNGRTTSQESSESLPNDESSLGEGSEHSSCDSQSEFPYEELFSEGFRQQLLVRSLTGKLRYKLHCQLSKELFTRLVQARLGGIVDCAGSSSTPRSELSSNGGPSVSRSNARTSNGKRVPDEENENNENDENSGKRDPKRPKSSSHNPPTTQTDPRRFACPYHKHDPRLFGVNTRFHGCAGQGFKDMAKLKEHLYRKHHFLLQCQRCKSAFKSQEQLDSHAESVTICQPRSRELRDGFTIEIFLFLRNKKKSFPNQGEEDKWREIYQLLFPDAIAMPWPYCEPNTQASIIPSILPNYLSLEEFSNFALPDEFNRRASALIWDTVKPLETQLSNQVVGIIHDSETAIDTQYRHLQNSHFQDHDLLHSTTDTSLISSSRHYDPLSWAAGPQDTVEIDFNNMMGDNLQASDPLSFGSSQNFAKPSNASEQLGNGNHSSDSGMGDSIPCFCIGVCSCQNAISGQSSTTRSDQSVETSNLAKDSNILDLLQSMTRSNLALEKSLLAMEKRLQNTESSSLDIMPDSRISLADDFVPPYRRNNNERYRS